ncbi:FHA domain-containing protein [Micromonospora musae]|uniref:FHA domain-containing protein n=1 Tax=Micromonospora musae TaxID=1894970 RepID=A0A3A9YI05_9ACTN|nr:FHA domain-containing protein [Micromonospora musae]
MVGRADSAELRGLPGPPGGLPALQRWDLAVSAAPTTRGVTLRVRSLEGRVTGLQLADGPITVGRTAPDHTPDVNLEPDPQRWVGRLHCTLDVVDGGWSVTDNASVNGTLLRTLGGRTERLVGRRRLRHGDTLLVLGDMSPEGEPLYWELTLLDPHTTQPAPFEPPPAVPVRGPSLRYDWVEARAYRCDSDGETAVSGLRPQGHQLLRYMVGRSSNGAAVACGHEELITALWGSAEEWPPSRSYTRADLAGVVRAVRRSIEADPSAPRLLETITGIGYRLNVHPADEAGDGR